MQETDVQVEGYCLIRIVSDRERSKVYIARDSAEGLCAVKVQKPADPAACASQIFPRGRGMIAGGWSCSGLGTVETGPAGRCLRQS